jgi:phosphoglycolate phosphatase-like HAD superfamily hydrolase
VRIVLFDIDGTLLLTGGAGLVALRRVFGERFGVADATEGIRFHGLTDPVILQSIATRHVGRELGPEELDELAAAYAEALPGALAAVTEFRVLPGVEDRLRELEARGDSVLGLATGNYERTAWAKLRRAGLDRYFSWGGFGSDSSDRTELTRLAVSRGRERTGPDSPVLVVGDTVHDVRCALAVGADCLAVATGNVSEETLHEAGAHWTVPDLLHPTAGRVLGADGRPAGAR